MKPAFVWENCAVGEMTFKQEQAYYKQIRRSNYLASSRLAGFDTKPSDVDNALPARATVLARYLPCELDTSISARLEPQGLVMQSVTGCIPTQGRGNDRNPRSVEGDF